MNKRHKAVLALSLAVAGMALWNGAGISQAVGIILVGGSLAWFIGSQFVVASATFVWRHRIWTAIIAAVGIGILYGWIRYDAHQTEKRQAIYECEERNNFAANSPVECEKDPSVTVRADQPVGSALPPGAILLPGETPIPPTDPWAPVPLKKQPPSKRGKTIMERNTCDDLVVYDREQYGGGNQLVIDRLATGDTVQLLGHVTVGEEDIVRTPNGQRGFVNSGCLETIPATKSDSEDEDHKQWCSKHPLDDSCKF